MTEKEIDLKDYVEGRFDRLAKSIDEKLKSLQDEFLSLVASNDLRYQQRFEAQGKELDKAFSAAKEAVSSALVANDKASVKNEQAADKRFDDLGVLIKEQFKGLTDKFDTVVRRIEVLEGRLNMSSGEAVGKHGSKEDSRSLWAILIAVGAVLLALWQSFKV